MKYDKEEIELIIEQIWEGVIGPLLLLLIGGFTLASGWMLALHLFGN